MAESEMVRMSFPGGRKVAAAIGGHEIVTDQPKGSGGEDEGPSPYSLFLMSIGACAGFYALAFFQKRELSTEGLEIIAEPRSTGTLEGVEIRVSLPDSFPERYRAALLRSIEQCSVKRAIEARPEFEVRLVEGEVSLRAEEPSHV